jgi:putative ABC transport system substrate-binding protein
MRKQFFDMSFGTLRLARSIFVATFFALCSMLLAPRSIVDAQQAKKIPTVGFLLEGFPSSVSDSTRIEAFRKGLREVGYSEGKDISIDYRFAEGKRDRLANLAAELVNLKVDVIVTYGTVAPLAVKRATTTIPIIMTSSSDPVGRGLVASLARPGGTVTGLSSVSPDLSGKRLELLKEAIPRLTVSPFFGTHRAKTQPNSTTRRLPPVR